MDKPICDQEFNINDFEIITQDNNFQNLLVENQSPFTVDVLIYGIQNDLDLGLISNEAHEKIMEAILVIDSIKFNDVVESSDAQKLIDKVKAIESIVINSGMNDYDKKYILSFTSVCRYSLAYWYDAPIPVQYSTTPKTLSSEKLSKAEWSMVAFADARGAQFAISSGAVGWATTFGSPAAGTAVLVASAAIFSATAYNEIKRH